jgi:hypothetical protein
VRRAITKPLASLVLSAMLLASLSGSVFAWANGGDGGNGYGTHDWIISQALKVFGGSAPAWLEVDTALLASDDPDKVFYATNEHVFNEKGYGRGAVDRITEFYHQALAAHQAGDDHTASMAFGWMAHYYGDILQPFHTNYAAIDRDTSHQRYELLVDKLTRRDYMAPEWMTADRTPQAVADVRTTAIAAAAYSRKFYPELYREFHANETILNARVKAITGAVLKRASSDLANLLYSIDHGVGDAAPAATVSVRLKYTYIAQSTTETVYVAVKDAAGHPLEGVKVDIAFPKASGGTTLIRRYTTADGHITAYAGIGASPIGHWRDVKVTVKTGAVTKTPTPRFMATRRLASGSAGFRSWVNDPSVYPGQTVRVASLARSSTGHPVTNLKVTWIWTFANGSKLKTTGTTDGLGKAVTMLPITAGTPKGTVSVKAYTQSGSVNRTSTTAFKRY